MTKEQISAIPFLSFGNWINIADSCNYIALDNDRNLFTNNLGIQFIFFEDEDIFLVRYLDSNKGKVVDAGHIPPAGYAVVPFKGKLIEAPIIKSSLKHSTYGDIHEIIGVQHITGFHYKS